MDEATRPGGVTPSAAPVGAAETRRVPAGGLDYWASPDATSPPMGTIAEGIDVEVVGRRGRWVHVVTDDGIDAWADGPTLAGVSVGPPGVAAESAAEHPHTHAPRVEPHVAVVEKRPSPITLAKGPLLGVAGAGIAILGAVLPWRQAVNPGAAEPSAFELPARFLTDGFQASQTGFEIGWLIVVVAGLAAILSMIRGGGVVRRVLGGAILLMCVLYVLQWQDFLTTFANAGLGRGLNVWDLVGYGVAVTFAGSIVMLAAPSR